MKAIQITRFGGPDVLQIVDLPRPEAGPGQALIKVHASGVNFADTLMRQDRYALTPPLPSVLGSEVAGTIEALGDGETGFALGQRVIAPLFAAGIHFGGYAEYVVIDAAWLAPVPTEVSFEAALALTVQGLSALYLAQGRKLEGRRVLISAAAGGVGSILVQLAKRAGAQTVIAAASTAEKRALTLALGADVAVDYTADDWLDRLADATGGAGPDVIFESTGGGITMAGLQALAPKGEMVIFGALNIQSFQLGVPDLLGLIFKNQSVTGFALAPLLTPDGLRDGLARLFKFVADGTLRVEIGGLYRMGAIAEAHRAIEGRGTTGKIILQP